MLLSDVCLSVAYIGPKSRTERPRKTKIGTEVAHVTRDSNITFKVNRSKGQGHQAALLTAVLARQAAEAVGDGNVLAVGNCCYVAGCSAVECASAPTGEERGGGGHTVKAARPQLVMTLFATWLPLTINRPRTKRLSA